jgi:hypothetical protein
MDQSSMSYGYDIVRRANGPNLTTLVILLPDERLQARRHRTGRPVPSDEAQLGGRSADSDCAGAGAADAALPR